MNANWEPLFISYLCSNLDTYPSCNICVLAKGPSLLAWNDAKFQEGDWDSIRSMHVSSKEDEPLKVGRFGLGFKSAYHMTGLNPSQTE